MNSLKLKNSFLLLLTAFIWGIAFVVQDSGGDALGPFTFNCLRAFIGGIVLLVLLVVKQIVPMGAPIPLHISVVIIFVSIVSIYTGIYKMKR